MTDRRGKTTFRGADLKPENLLLKSRDKPIDKDNLRAVDFGLSTFFQDGQTCKEVVGCAFTSRCHVVAILSSMLPWYAYGRIPDAASSDSRADPMKDTFLHRLYALFSRMPTCYGGLAVRHPGLD